MGTVEIEDLPDQALLLIDSAPLIYHFEAHPRFGPRFRPIFEAHAAGRVRFAVTTITAVEVLTGSLRQGDVAGTHRYRTIFNALELVPLDLDIAERAAELRASLRLKLADSIQAASALAINAAAIVTHDRDFSRVRSLRIIS